MMVDALIKLVDSAPTMQASASSFYAQGYQNYDITQAEFALWTNYVDSVLKTLYEFAGLNEIYSTQINISQIMIHNELLFMERIFQIKHELLELARKILNS